MKRVVDCCLFILLAASLSLAQTLDLHASRISSAARVAVQDTGTTQGPEIRGAFPTTLVKSLDSKKLKAGDIVVCQTSATLRSRSGLLIPNGTKVIGHVTQAQARGKGATESSLEIVFDKIQLSTGKEIPMKGALQAVGPVLGDSGPDTGPGGGLGMGGHGGNAADTATTPGPTNGVAGPNSGIHPLADTRSRPILNAQSQGVLGIKNLEMGKDSILTSTEKEVKLESGTQMLIRAEIEKPVE